MLPKTIIKALKKIYMLKIMIKDFKKIKIIINIENYI